MLGKTIEEEYEEWAAGRCVSPFCDAMTVDGEYGNYFCDNQYLLLKNLKS